MHCSRCCNATVATTSCGEGNFVHNDRRWMFIDKHCLAMEKKNAHKSHDIDFNTMNVMRARWSRTCPPRHRASTDNQSHACPIRCNGIACAPHQWMKKLSRHVVSNFLISQKFLRVVRMLEQQMNQLSDSVSARTLTRSTPDQNMRFLPVEMAIRNVRYDLARQYTRGSHSRQLTLQR